ncbi:hypothetical protein HUU42_14485 [bacterium]|nr:hypothetical protein [bacterium]
MNKRILIFHSNIDELAAIRQILAKEGCEIMTASNWNTAAKLVSNIEIDYVLMDVQNDSMKQALLQTFKQSDR